MNWSFRRDRRAARHRRSTGAEWQIASEIAPRAGEPIVEKRFGDAFAQTTLTDVLAALDGDHLIVAGMQTDFCVNATIGGAAERGIG